MFKKINLFRKNVPRLFSAVLCLFFFVLLISQISQTVFALPDTTENPYLVERFWAGGKQIDKVSFPGKPPKFFRAPAAAPIEPNIAMGINGLTNVPAFYWSYGCSATSAAMMAGYYDNNGYPNMYDGPENGGVCPMTNAVWGHTVYPGVTCGECPLSATHLGYDDLTDSGHVDDYWVDYLDAGPDPYLGNWAEHVSADCTGDFMKTNRAAYGNVDGSTNFLFYTDGSPTYYADLDAVFYGVGTYADYDGGCGLQNFFESRGTPNYTVTTMYNQYIYGYGGNTQGFTFDQFQAEIDAGRPVLIHLYGHTMLGYGYNTAGSLIYIHDTWNYSNNTMTWGGSYGGYPHIGVTVISLAASPQGTVILDGDYYPAFATVDTVVSDSDLNITDNADTTTVEFESELTADTAIIELTETDTSTGIFMGLIELELNAVPAIDSVLQVDIGDTITVTYIDANNGEGGTNIEVTDTALIIDFLEALTGLTATQGVDNSVTLQWNSIVSPILAGYNVYRSTSPDMSYLVRLNTIHLIYASPFEDVGLTAGATYYYYVTAEDTFGNETDPSNIVSVTITGGGDDGVDDGTGTGTDGSSSGGGVGSLSGCFIATASYGTPMADEVKVLSEFRDEYLLSNSLGRIFVGAYYKFSPRLAEYICERPALKKFIRIGLKPLVSFSEKLVEE